jgi:hypothetical protein
VVGDTRVQVTIVYETALVPVGPECELQAQAADFASLLPTAEDVAAFIALLATQLQELGWTGTASNIFLAAGSVRAQLDWLVPSISEVKCTARNAAYLFIPMCDRGG